MCTCLQYIFRGAEPRVVPWEVCACLFQHGPPACGGITVGVCGDFKMEVCEVRRHCESSETIRAVDPSLSALCKWNPTLTQAHYLGPSPPPCPAPINTHHVGHISKRWPLPVRSEEGMRGALYTPPCVFVMWRNSDDYFQWDTHTIWETIRCIWGV